MMISGGTGTAVGSWADEVIQGGAMRKRDEKHFSPFVSLNLVLSKREPWESATYLPTSYVPL